jgi:hypothetical protein
MKSDAVEFRIGVTDLIPERHEHVRSLAEQRLGEIDLG